ncbi:hypothetical protein V8C86DRAFT_2555756 [Haematococcus lacustris]
MEPSFLNVILQFSLPLHMDLHPACAASLRRRHTTCTAGSMGPLTSVGVEYKPIPAGMCTRQLLKPLLTILNNS